jgi:hypothetical protein
MAAFTDEQVKILIAAFEHVWTRINALHSNVTEDTVRLAALTSFLELQGTIDEEQATSVAEEFHDEGSSEGEMTTAPGFAGDKTLTERILRGEVDADRRQREAEERARQEDRD